MAEIDALTFPEFHDLTRYWQAHPPAHLLLAAILGLQPKKQGSWQELAELFGQTQPAP